MEEIIDREEAKGKIYSESKVAGATFLGGPLVAGYMIAENYKALDHPDKAKTAWIYASVFALVLFGIGFLLPESVNIPSYILPLLCIVVARSVVKQQQGGLIASHLTAGGQEHSWGRTIVISLIGLSLTLVVIFAVVIIANVNTAFEEKVKIINEAQQPH